MIMLRKIRLQFILIASVAVTVILIAFAGVLNSARYIQNNSEIELILNLLSENDGQLPAGSELAKALTGSHLTVNRAEHLSYFSYVLDGEGAILSSDMTHNQSLTEEGLNDFKEALESAESSSIIYYGGRYYAHRETTATASNSLVVVLDISHYIDERTELFETSFQMSAYSLIFFVVVVFIFSGWAIKPYVENAENQKRFITNAGHELKTPLAIISANTEMQELLDGETEWSRSTKAQVQRLTGLINQMVTLAKLEEQPDVVLSELDFSRIVQDAAEDFKAALIKDGKAFELDVAPDVLVKGEEKSLFELVTILVDNATKYCDPEGKVTVRLSKTPLKKANLEVANTYQAGKGIDYSRFFDRFYREDSSHNSRVSGYGIGLSMAQSMVRLFRGKISVHYKDDTITFKVVL